jgi:hypothetical protein
LAKYIFVVLPNYLFLSSQSIHVSYTFSCKKFNSLLKITNNNTLVFSITNHNKPKIPRKERLCKFCTEVETEEHFLISCHKYKDIGKTFFQSYGQNKIKYNCHVPSCPELWFLLHEGCFAFHEKG